MKDTLVDCDSQSTVGAFEGGERMEDNKFASYNGADMYKYNMIYTFKINQHVLTPES